MMRRTPVRVKTETSIPTSSGRPRCARPPTPEYSPSLFSRTMIQSRSFSPRPRRGLVIPGRMRAGRTLAYWSNPWQIARRSPQRVMWSGTVGWPTAPKKMASNPFSVSRPSSAIIRPCS